MKAIMLSIQPKYCELIASGKKTVEVRKTAPKTPTPFKCYIYCTKPPRSELFHHGGIYEYAHELIRLQDGRIVYDYGMRLACEDGEYSRDNFLCQKVIGEFVCDKIEKYDYFIEKPLDKLIKGEYRHYLSCNELERTCLHAKELEEYLGEKDGYGWHISALKIYDEPKELGEFYSTAYQKRCGYCTNLCEYYPDCSLKANRKPLIRPPMSWCYVEELIE